MKITGGELTEQEISAYRAHAKAQNCELVEIHVDGDEVELKMQPVPFERIRRITGYLVGTTDRWNDAKLAELNERVTHKLKEDKPC